MNLHKFRGTGVALVTPFTKDHHIDFNTLEELIEKMIAGGVDFFVSLGTTGEAVTLSADECRQVFDFTIDKVNGRKPIVAGLFGSNYTDKIVKVLKEYDLDGFDAIMSSSPAYNKPPQEGIYRHYMAIAEASPKPIIIYNVPGRTGSNVAPETVLRLANDSDKFIAVKEASGDLGQAAQIIKNKPDNFLVLSGEDPLTVPMISLGGDGVISVMANVYPKLFSDMIRAALNGDFAKAAAIHLQLLDVHPWLYIESNPVGVKAAMAYRGWCEKTVRIPLVPLSDESTSRLITEMDKVKAVFKTLVE